MAVLKQYWIEILLIDSNKRTECLSDELKQLPDRFKSFPPQAADVRIGWCNFHKNFQLSEFHLFSADLTPRDFDCEWDPKLLAHVKKWIQNENHHYYQGLIKLSIMNTLWVDSIDVIEILHSINEEVKTVSIKKNLLQGNFCVKDLKPLELMMGLAKNAGLLKPNDADIKSAQIVDTRTTEVFNNSGAASIDLDESDVSHLSWATSIDDDDPEICRKNSSTSSAHEEDLLRLSEDKWAELSSQFNKVFLCNFFHPNRIYIRNHNYSSRYAQQFL